ncbi:MAG: HutP family protein [Candidatus Limnocylindria bacterium]
MPRPDCFGAGVETVGLRFAIVQGPRLAGDGDLLWLAMAMCGTIGAPVRGYEHEVVGLGINHI